MFEKMLLGKKKGFPKIRHFCHLRLPATPHSRSQWAGPTHMTAPAREPPHPLEAFEDLYRRPAAVPVGREKVASGRRLRLFACWKLHTCQRRAEMIAIPRGKRIRYWVVEMANSHKVIRGGGSKNARP